MPAQGGKIASLRVRSEELLQAPLRPYAPPTQSIAFSEADGSGWDECLPSVAPCQIETEAGHASIPDHGDLWRVEWQVLNASEDSATMRADGFSLPLQLTRSIILTEAPFGWRIQLLYSLTNLGAYEVPWAWSAHPLFAVDPGDRISLPPSIHSLRIEDSRGKRLGSKGDAVSWPMAQLADGLQFDLSTAGSPDSEIGDKLSAGPFASVPEGHASLERLQLGLRLTVAFEPALTPYLGLWLCYGGWPDSPGARQNCVALEPSTSPVDSLEQTGDWSRRLEPGVTFTWPMELRIERTQTGTVGSTSIRGEMGRESLALRKHQG